LSEHQSKKIKTGVKEGGGPDPGYEWTVQYLTELEKESLKLLNKAQHEHLVLQFKELAGLTQPLRCKTISLDKIEDFHELKDRGGVFGGLNVRVFFGIDDSSRSIIILGLITKQNNGATPPGDRIRMRRRWRKYKNGEYQ